MSIHDRQQTRRKVFLEILSLTVPMASAVFFSSWFITGWAIGIGAIAAAGTVLALGAYWVWHRSRYPANIDPPSDQKDVDDVDDDGWWDPVTILLFIVSVVVVVVVGIVTQFVLPLLVVALFGFGFGADLGDVTRAALAMLAVSFVLEFAIVIPLCKLWCLDMDADPEPRSTYCPTPSGQG